MVKQGRGPQRQLAQRYYKRTLVLLWGVAQVQLMLLEVRVREEHLCQ